MERCKDQVAWNGSPEPLRFKKQLMCNNGLKLYFEQHCGECTQILLQVPSPPKTCCIIKYFIDFLSLLNISVLFHIYNLSCGINCLIGYFCGLLSCCQHLPSYVPNLEWGIM